MKNKILKLLTLPLLIGLTACDKGGTYIGCISSKGAKRIAYEYSLFKGEDNHTLSFNGDTAIDVSVTTKSGKLFLDIVNTDDNKNYYSGNFTDDQKFTVNVPEGKYKFSLSAPEGHKGSYSFTWEK